MFKIGKKKKVKKEQTPEAPQQQEESVAGNSAFVGSYPGKPWEKLTDIHHGRGSRIKFLNKEEQKLVVEISIKYFKFTGKEFPKARLKIQEEFDRDDPTLADDFFTRAIFTEKRLAVRAYLSNAEGRYISHDRSLKLLKNIADAALDFEVGAIDYYINEQLQTELIVGDGTEVVSENGYWFSHTHPAKTGVTSNFLPSTQDLDVMLLTARAHAQHLEKFETDYYVFRDVGFTKVTIKTSMEAPPSPAKIEHIDIEYSCENEIEGQAETHLKKIKFHLRTRHALKEDQIEISNKTGIDLPANKC